MTGHTVLFRLLNGHFPTVRFVAILACQVHLQVNLVFAGIRNRRVALDRAGCPVRPGPQVRVMACPAFELHRSLIRDIYLDSFLHGFIGWSEMLDVNRGIACQFLPYFFIAMTEEAFFPLRQQVGCAVSMAVETGQFTHRCFFMWLVCCAVRAERLVFVTGQTISFFQRKFVSSVPMALGAFNLLDENVLCMIA